LPDSILIHDRKRVFILGPSHHYGLDDCALTKQTLYDTPLGTLEIDEEGEINLEYRIIYSNVIPSK